jgi:NitT/TauT family transport system substrate-binding protein
LRKAIVVVGVVVGALILLAAWKILPRSQPHAQTLTPIAIAQTGDFFLYAGLYVAQDTGAFDRHGLKVRITNTGGDEKSAAAVLSGHAQIGIGDPTFAAIAKAKGQDLRVVASLVSGAPFWGITNSQAVADRYAKSGLEGLRVATFPAPSTAYTLQAAMFRKRKLPVSIVPGAFGSLQGILESGKADVALELEPNVSAAQERGAKVLYSMAKENGDLAITGAVVSGAFAKQQPQALRAFCASLSEAYTYMRDHKAETEALLAKRFPDLPGPAVSSALQRMLDEKIIPETPVTDPAAWRRALELRAAVGDIADPSLVEGALDNSFCN